ncbi:MAG: alcohol dehydrogenase catalytic domain-containing protein [Thermodesulfovibrionales bacterium]|nr:alcohol dehydrogenase catalytic domain-containing protein [Thermodesulfovibrionales bacterium]
MRANILVEPGNIQLREIDNPFPSRGELVIKIRVALTCGTDLKAYTRGHPVIPLPGVFGHEFSGVVSSVGKGVRGFREGDEIMAVHSAPCLSCRYCEKKLYNLCENIMNAKVLGAFAEYILLPHHIVAQNVFHKPKNLSFEEAAFLEPLSCVIHGMEPLSIQRGVTALIIGSGPIGLLHLLLLKEKGARVTMMDINRTRLATAKKFGAEKTCRPEKLLNLSQTFTKGMGFDFVFECTGMPEVWEASVHFVRRGGTVILFGGCKSGTTVTYDTGRIHYDEITLKGVFHFTPQDVKKAYELLCSRKLKVSRLISGRYSLEKIQTAFKNLSNGRGIKYAIIP